MRRAFRVGPVCVCAVLVCLICRDVVAQGLQEQTLRVDVLLQQIVATVTDAEGSFVTNLKPADFVVEVDGVSQTIAHFTQDADTPISLGFVIDMSKSMKFSKPASIASATSFVNELHSADEAFLMTFDAGVKIPQDLTQDMPRMVRALDKLRGANADGGTNVILAVMKASEKLRQAKNRKKALIVISDGVDVVHSIEFAEFMSAVRASEVIDYSVQLDAPKPHPGFDPARTPCKDVPASAGPPMRGAQTQEQACREYIAKLERSIDLYWNWTNRALHYFHLDLSNWSPVEVNSYKYDLKKYDFGVNPVEDKLAQLMMQAVAAETGGKYFGVDAMDSPNKLEDGSSRSLPRFWRS